MIARRLGSAPSREPFDRAPVIPAPEDPDLPRLCWGDPVDFGFESEGPEGPSTSVDIGDDGCPEDTPKGQFSEHSDFSPTPLRDGECENEIPLPTWTQIWVKWETVRVTNPDDAEQYVDVERWPETIMRGPDNRLERWVFPLQPEEGEVQASGFRGQEPDEDGNMPPPGKEPGNATGDESGTPTGPNDAGSE